MQNLQEEDKTLVEMQKRCTYLKALFY